MRSQVCLPTKAYEEMPIMYDWCKENCLSYPPNCDPEFCTCRHVNPPFFSYFSLSLIVCFSLLTGFLVMPLVDWLQLMEQIYFAIGNVWFTLSIIVQRTSVSVNWLILMFPPTKTAKMRTKIPLSILKLRISLIKTLVIKNNFGLLKKNLKRRKNVKCVKKYSLFKV